MSTYKYLIVYAHADVRETGGLLTEDTPKGWGNLEIVVDHPIDEQADLDEIAKQVGHNERKEDGSTRYTHVAVNEVKLLETIDEEFESNVRTLSADDFLTDIGSGWLTGIPLGDDDTWAMYGHDVTLDEVRESVATYWAAVGAGPEYTTDAIVGSALRRVWAVPTFYDDGDWSLEWGNKTEHDAGAVPVTVVAFP